MPNILTVKLDVTLIDKARLFTGKQAKDGHVPKYLDLVLIPRKEAGQYGDTHLVKQSVTKDERMAGIELPIIGNATERGVANTPPPPASAPRVTPPQENPDDVPF